MILDCGHEPSPHGKHTTGTAHTSDGREICWACSDAEERTAFQYADKYLAYLSGDSRTVTTWPGGHLAHVTRVKREERYTPSGVWYERYYVWASGDHGSRWFGIGAGPGCCVTLRRTKG